MTPSCYAPGPAYPHPSYPAYPAYPPGAETVYATPPYEQQAYLHPYPDNGHFDAYYDLPYIVQPGYAPAATTYYGEPRAKQRVSSILFLAIMLCLIAGLFYLFAGVIGFESLMDLYGFEIVADKFGAGPPPKL